MCFLTFPAKADDGDRMEHRWHEGRSFECDQAIDGHVETFCKPQSEENHPMMLWLMRPVVVRNPRGCVGMFLYFV